MTQPDDRFRDVQVPAASQVPRLGQESGGDNASRVAEARRILFDMGLRDHIDEMDGNSQHFVNSLLERLNEYGDDTFVSAKQLFWLRDLKDRFI